MNGTLVRRPSSFFMYTPWKQSVCCLCVSNRPLFFLQILGRCKARGWVGAGSGFQTWMQVWFLGDVLLTLTSVSRPPGASPQLRSTPLLFFFFLFCLCRGKIEITKCSISPTVKQCHGIMSSHMVVYSLPKSASGFLAIFSS